MFNIRFKIVLLLFSFVFAAPAFAGEGDHHLAIFGGVTKHGNKSYSIVGADYEYGVTDWFGVGLVAESIATEPGTTLGLVMGSLYPFGGLRLFAGAGQESASGHNDSVTRVGASYTIHLGLFSITPMAAHDSTGSGTSSDTLGVSFGIGI